MSHPAAGGQAFNAKSAGARCLILNKALEEATHDARFLTAVAAMPDHDLVALDDDGEELLYTTMLRWRLEWLRDACDEALAAFADRAGENRERELIRHLREANYPGPEGENAKRLADVRERKLEARQR